tara:strand:+ start:1623 stop:1856 length:234 start_codon:yes stop_codon:yes gene_type:complete
MNWDNRKYVIINVSALTDAMKEHASYEEDILLNRQTTDGSKVLLKWDGDTPSCFDGLATYTNSEILTELAKSEWTGE